MSGSPFLILESLGKGQIPLADPTTLGRATDNAVVLADASVSSHHAVIRKDGAFWIVEDLGSTNGTWLNRRRVDGGAVVKEGDRIQMGSQMVRLSGFRSSPRPRLPEATPLCPVCRRSLPEGAAFCPSCGLPQGGRMAQAVGEEVRVPVMPTAPAVPAGKDLIRTAISAMHTEEQLEKIAEAMAYAVKKL